MFFTAKEWQPLLRAHGLNSVADVYGLNGGTVFTKTGTTEVRRVELGDRQIFVKKYWVTKPSQIVSGVARGAVFGKSKVRREYENLQWLRAHGFDAPAPVAYGEERRARCLLRSCLITEAIPDARGLDALILEGRASSWPRRANGRDKARPSNELLKTLADYLRRLHEHHFIHRDLFWRNILVSGNHFYLIDAHKGGYRRGTPAHDLATLDAPAPAFFRRTERLRFFLRYLNHDKLTAADKRLARRVLALAEPMRERQIGRVRRGR